MKHILVPALLFLAATASGADWPREIASPQGMIMIYQPQITAFDGNAMSARTAISVTPAGESAPMFGAVWLDAHVLTDRPTRTVRILDLMVKQIRFPNRGADETAAISSSIEQEIPRWDLTFSLDELTESLETAQKERENAHDIDLSPPKIIVMDRPAVLVQIDGDPVFSDVEGSNLRRVVNTPYFIAQEVSSGALYLHGGDNWYAAREIAGPWRVTPEAPEDVVNVAAQSASDDPAAQAAQASTPAPGTGKIPEIVVSTVPAELIASDGPLQLSPIEGTGLLYATNTQSKLFLAIDSRAYYILISGRWYTSARLEGPWAYVAADKLPEDFAKIPPGSDRDAVLASVAGTLPAKEAVLDAQIPQTAEVDRMETSEQVDYDGDPQFQPVENSDMQYAVNTATPVVLVGGRYYACDRGIWFESVRARGPWAVSIAIPGEIYRIPPRCPIYYVRYVRIYSYTPSVVYVGYTSGYTGCYVYNHTVIYGTGYRYHPWLHRHYYPRPWTWGFGVHYEPWTGWSMGYSTGWWKPRGWFAYNWSTVHPGWWGPVGYRPAYHPVRGPVYQKGYQPVYRPLPAPKTRTVVGATRTPADTRGRTLYDRWTTGVRRPTAGSMPRTPLDVIRPAPGTRTPVQPVRVPEATPRPIQQPIRVPESRPPQQPERIPEANPRPIQQPQPIRTPEAVPRPAPAVEPIRVAPNVMPAPRPVARDNNVYTTPEGGIVRKTPQGWQERTQGAWKPAVQTPPAGGIDRDAEIRQRAAERANSFRMPTPPPQRVVTPPPPVQRPQPAIQPQRQPPPPPPQKDRTRR